MMTRQYAKVIVNPVAGANSTHRKWPHIRSLLKLNGLLFDYQHTEGIGHAIELAREATVAGYHSLVAVGGDGTVNEVANGILTAEGRDASLGVVNTGTGSDFVRSIHIPRDYINACPCVTSQTRMKIDIGVVEFKKNGDTKRRYFLNAAGAGFDAEVAEATGNLPKYFRGTIPYLIGLVRKLFRYTNKFVSLGIDSRSEERKVLSVVVANGCYFGGGMKVAPQADLSDSLFDVLTIGDIGKFELIKAFPTIYKGTHIHHPKVRMERANRIEISSPERLLIHADGEILGEGPASFSIMPAALSIVV